MSPGAPGLRFAQKGREKGKGKREDQRGLAGTGTLLCSAGKKVRISCAKSAHFFAFSCVFLHFF